MHWLAASQASQSRCSIWHPQWPLPWTQRTAHLCAPLRAGDAASVSEHGRQRPARPARRGTKRKGPWVSVYSGPDRACRVDSKLFLPCSETR